MNSCRRLGVSGRVHFVGVVDNVEHWLAKAAIAVQPSRFEGFRNAVMEAMAMGVATISPDCASWPADLIEHMHNGMLVPIGDVSAVTHAMELLMSDPVLSKSLGSRAMSVIETFSPRRIMTKWHMALALG